MIYPSFLKKRDTIGICAPSAGVGHKLESFDKSLKRLQSAGFNTFETDSVRINSLRPASGKQRADEFNSLLNNSEIKIILAASGGEYNMEVLPYIDVDCFKKNPKWIIGASDPTNIVYYLTTKYDIATIYGVNAGTFDWEPEHEFQSNAIELLQGRCLTQHSFEYFDTNRDFSMSCQKLDGVVNWKIYAPEGIKLDTIEASGRLIGGCSDVISNLCGTPYDCAAEFIARYQADGIIWYFDPFVTSPIDFHLLMLKFKYAGYFTHAKAVIIGRIMFPGDYTEEDYIEELKNDFDCPFIWGADIGHVKPCMTLINGSFATISCSGGKAVLKMELR